MHGFMMLHTSFVASPWLIELERLPNLLKAEGTLLGMEQLFPLPEVYDGFVRSLPVGFQRSRDQLDPPDALLPRCSCVACVAASIISSDGDPDC